MTKIKIFLAFLSSTFFMLTQLTGQHALPQIVNLSNGKKIEVAEEAQFNLDGDSIPIYYLTFDESLPAISIGADQVWLGGENPYDLTGIGTHLCVFDEGRIRATHQENYRAGNPR